MSRHRKSNSNYEQHQGGFMEDLEQSLLQSYDPNGINAFQNVFHKKKIINQMISREKKLKEQAHLSYLKAKQRVAQIQQLQLKVQKQTSLLKSQVQKIKDAHNISKLLMMQKIVKLQRETQEVQRKRQLCHQIKVQQQRQSLAYMSRNFYKIQKARLENLTKTVAVKRQNDIRNYHTLQENRNKAESVKADRERRNGRLKRIQDFKLQRAHKNYTEKLQNLQKTLQVKQNQLVMLNQKQRQKKQHLSVTQNVTQEYLNNFFATAANTSR